MPETGKLDDLMPAIMSEFEKGKCIRLYPRGVSMLPMLDGQKDSVLLSPHFRPLQKYDVPLYRRPDGRYVLHRIVRVHSGGYDCCGDNQLQVENNVCDDWIIAKVVGFTRNGRSYTTTQPGYCLYSRMIVCFRPVRSLLHKIKGFVGKCRRHFRNRNH